MHRFKLLFEKLTPMIAMIAVIAITAITAITKIRVALADEPAATPDTPAVAAVAAIDTASAFEELGRSIRGALGKARVNRPGVGVKIVDLTSNRDVFSLRGTEPLTPASTMKLITSSTALGLFGATFRVPTEILADTLDGTLVKGNLYLKGHGDPTFNAVDLDSLVDVLKIRGIKKITGDIVGDATFFDDVVDRSQYSGDGEMVEELPPISALTINRNRVTIVAHAAARGERVRVQAVPHVPCIALASNAVSVAPRAARRKSKHQRASIEATPHIISAVYFLPAMHRRKHSHNRPLVHHRGRAGGLSFTVGKNKSGKQFVSVSGALVVGGTASRVVELSNPPLAAASMLKFRLESNGIAVDGDATVGETPMHAVKLAAKETPLVEICAMLNKNSDNFAAEQLFKIIGATCCGVASSDVCCIADSSVKYINVFLSSCKINASKCAFHDGSGLSHHAAITPDAKVDLLKSMHARDTLFNAFYSTLAIGGVDGTIRSRMRGTPAQNNVHAKTGTLNSVTALAGYVTTRDGELWAFDITMNSARVHLGRSVQDKIVEKLAGFSYAGK